MTTRDDDELDEVNGDDGYTPSVADVVRRWRYTLCPTLYTNEDSSTDDLLWQQVLETRAVRAWLVLVLAALVVGVVALVLVATGTITR